MSEFDEFEEELDLDEWESIPPEASPASEEAMDPTRVDRDIDEFAEDAFDSILKTGVISQSQLKKHMDEPESERVSLAEEKTNQVAIGDVSREKKRTLSKRKPLMSEAREKESTDKSSRSLSPKPSASSVLSNKKSFPVEEALPTPRGREDLKSPTSSGSLRAAARRSLSAAREPLGAKRTSGSIKSRSAASSYRSSAGTLGSPNESRELERSRRKVSELESELRDKSSKLSEVEGQLSKLQAELRSARQEHAKAISAQSESANKSLDSALENLRVEMQRKLERSVEEAERRRQADALNFEEARNEEFQAVSAEHQEMLEGLERQFQDESREMENKFRDELAQLQAKLQKSEETVRQAERDKKSLSNTIDERDQTLVAYEEKFQGNEDLLERALKAVNIAGALLDERATKLSDD